LKLGAQNRDVLDHQLVNGLIDQTRRLAVVPRTILPKSMLAPAVKLN